MGRAFDEASVMKKKVLIVHQQIFGLERVGGAEALCAWTIQALKDDYNITVAVPYSGNMTQHPELLNAQYGTALGPEDFSVIVPFHPILHTFLSRSWILHTHVFMRYVRALGPKYDVCISTYNEIDFGREVTGLQYLHYPMLPETQGTAWRFLAGNMYRRLVSNLFGFRQERMLQNRTLTCSRWTRSIIEKRYPVSVEVLYPPVPDPVVTTPWEKRTQQFLFVGRISPEKRIEDCIEILTGVRERGYDVSLCIVGPAPVHEYALSLYAKATKLPWVRFYGSASVVELTSLFGQSRYGINGTQDEQFGIALAQMCRAGCVVFAPAQGGQMEVLRHDSRILFTDMHDAIEKIVAVLGDLQLGQNLHASAAQESSDFDPSHFMTQIRDITEDMLAHKTV